MKRVLAIGLVVVLLIAALPVGSMALSQYGTVVGGWLRLRSEASFNASTLASYYTGTSVKILASSGSWYKVEAPDGLVGYMYSSYVSLEGGGGGGGGGTGNATVRSANGLGVRMRSGPGKGYRVVAVYSVGTSVSVLNSGTYWSKIQVGSRIGYMMSEFLDYGGGGGGGGGTGQYATVWSPNGYGVRLRTGPGKGYGIIGVYSVGTRVELVSHGATWDQVRVGSRTGYMMNYYLRYASTAIVTGVALSPAAANAAPGETVQFTATVGGTNLSSPAYTLAITQNASLATLSGDKLTVSASAPVGSQIVVTATSVDCNSSGARMSASSTVTVVKSTGVATGIALAPASNTAKQGSTVKLTTTVTGTNLSAPAYTLSVDNTTYAAISGDSLVVYGNAPVGTKFTVTATTVDNDATGKKLTATATVEAILGDAVVTQFSVTPTSATATIGADVTLTPVVKGINLSTPAVTVSIPSSQAAYADASLLKDGTISVYLFSSCPDNATINVTVKAVNAKADGTIPEITVPIKAVRNDYIKSIKVYPDRASIYSGAYLFILADITYENGSVETGVTASRFNIVASGNASYVTVDNSGKMVTANAYAGTDPVTVTIKGTSVETKADGSTVSGEGSFVIKPLAKPGAPVLSSAKASKQQVTVSWAQPTDIGGSPITSNTVYYQSSDMSAPLSVTVAGGLSATVGSLDDGKAYTFWVTASNAQGESPASNTLSATPEVSVPDAPTGLTIGTVSDGTVSMSWSAPADDGGSPITDYKVFWSDTGAIKTSDYKTTSGATGYTMTGLTNGTTYTFWVAAINAKGASATSTPQSAVPSVRKPDQPAAPTLNAVTQTSASLQWVAPNDNGSAITGYKLYRDGAEIADIKDPTQTSYTNDSLTPGTTYVYKVTAINKGGESLQSDGLTVATQSAVTQPGMPQSPAATATGTSSITITWSDSSDNGGSAITEYRLYRKGGAAQLNPSGDLSKTFNDTGLNAGTLYEYEITAYNGTLESDRASASATTQSAVTQPGMPQSPAATATGTSSITITWSDSLDNGGSAITEYRLYRKGGATQLNPSGDLSKTFNDTGLNAGTLYEYEITAYNGTLESDRASASATTQSAATVPGAPTGLAGTPTTDSVALTWSAPTDNGGDTITGYHVYRDGTFIGSSVNANYTDTGLTAGTTYVYKVSAVNSVGEGATSSECTVTTNP